MESDYKFCHLYFVENLRAQLRRSEDLIHNPMTNCRVTSSVLRFNRRTWILIPISHAILSFSFVHHPPANRYPSGFDDTSLRYLELFPDFLFNFLLRRSSDRKSNAITAAVFRRNFTAPIHFHNSQCNAKEFIVIHSSAACVRISSSH